MGFLPLCQHIVMKVRREAAQWDDVSSRTPPSGFAGLPSRSPAGPRASVLGLRTPAVRPRAPSGPRMSPAGALAPPGLMPTLELRTRRPVAPAASGRYAHVPAQGRSAEPGGRPCRTGAEHLDDRLRTEKGGSHALLRRLPPPDAERIGMIPRFHDTGRAVPAGKSAWEPPYFHQSPPGPASRRSRRADLGAPSGPVNRSRAGIRPISTRNRTDLGKGGRSLSQARRRPFRQPFRRPSRPRRSPCRS